MWYWLLLAYTLGEDAGRKSKQRIPYQKPKQLHLPLREPKQLPLGGIVIGAIAGLLLGLFAGPFAFGGAQVIAALLTAWSLKK